MASQNNLIVVAHMDDEIFGMGGTLHKMKRRGDDITIIVAVNEGENEDRSKEFEIILQKLGVMNAGYLGLSNSTLDTVSSSELITGLMQMISKQNFTHCYTHSKKSGNQHHKKIAEVTEVAARDIPNLFTFILPENLIRSPGFRPNYWEGLLKEDLNFKKEAGFIYGVYKPITVRTPEAMEFNARHTGMEYGIKFAEKFELIRGLNV